MPQLTLLLLLFLSSGASASHFYGGTMSFTSKGQNADGSFKVEFRFKEAYAHACYPFNSWYCSSGNCGIATAYQGEEIDAMNSGYQWCQFEGFVTRRILSNRPFEMRTGSCCWVYNVRGNWESWRLLTHVDLGNRSDTGDSNKSPLTTILPLIRIPQNCPRAINLMAHDPDGDRVRCRHGLTSNIECGDCYSHPNIPLDQDTCTLQYTYSSLGAYAFELVLEDYPRQYISLSYTDGSQSVRSPLPLTPSHVTAIPASTASSISNISPLSSIPLQFAIRVDAPVASCTEGLYLPRFLHPTPYNGEFLNASLGQDLEIKVKAEATISQLSEFIISGPINITKSKTLNGTFAELTITWTPTDNDLGEHFPICFIAESRSGSRVYQSEMRCVIAIVGPRTGSANVVCTDTTMTVEVEKTRVIALHEGELHLNDPSCTLTSNSTHVIGIMSLNSCGTELEEDNDNLIFKNEITTMDEPYSVITRKHEVEIGFSCVYPKKGSVSLEFKAHKIPYVFTERGFGKFTFQFEFFQTNLFNRMVDPSTYPVEVALKEMIYMEIESTSSIPNTVLFVESCRATPIDDPTYHIFYTIIENGCIIDDTLQLYSGNVSNFRFGMEAFKFIGMHNEVYMSCSVILCHAGDPNTRCAQGCISATAAPVTHHHHRRSVAAETSRHYISQGPLRLKRNLDISVTSPNLNMNLWLWLPWCVE